MLNVKQLYGYYTNMFNSIIKQRNVNIECTLPYALADSDFTFYQKF